MSDKAKDSGKEPEKEKFEVEELDSQLEDVSGGSCNGCDSCAGGPGKGCAGCGAKDNQTA